MDINEARRITIDVSFDHPDDAQRVAAVVGRELDKIRQQRDPFPEGVPLGDRGFVYYPRHVPFHGTIRYRMDPKRRK